MKNFYSIEEEKFGITETGAINKTKEMLRREADQIEGITLILKSYVKDIDAVQEVVDMQDKFLASNLTASMQEKLEKEISVKRARIDNQVLIKNYNFSEFIKDIDNTVQDLMIYMVKRNELNCFPAYIVDFIWKMI